MKAYRERYLGMPGRNLAEYGAVVSFRNEQDESYVCWCVGPVAVAVRDACEKALALDSTFRVVCISTPTTIFGDLCGRSPLQDNTGAYRPEGNILARAGMRHMLHHDLRGRSRQSEIEWRNVP